MPQQPQQPRRILEKSRTVRRRYQRSNKRFEFSASQIQRIEREEEREKKAKQLREREKKKLANKKKRAEKEAKEREERRRLGIQEPNSCKIPASQPLLLNFFGTGSKKGVDVKEQVEEETEDSVFTQENEALEKDDSTDAANEESEHEILSPMQDDETDVMQESEASDEDEMIEVAEDEKKQNSLSPVQVEKPLMIENQQTHPPVIDNTTDCISEDFSDLETELGDDWLDDVELEKHMASIENTQQNLSSVAATYKDGQPAETAQSATNHSAGMTESFEDDTSLMLQALDPTVLEKFETPQPKVAFQDADKEATSDIGGMSQHSALPSPCVSKYVASNARMDNVQHESYQVNNSTARNFKNISPATNWHTSTRQTPREIIPQSQRIAQKQQPRSTVISSNTKTASIQTASYAGTFEKPAVAVSMQPGRFHFSPKKSVSQSTKIYPTQKVYFQSHFDAEDEFGDLPLSTQDVRDLDSMVGLG